MIDPTHTRLPGHTCPAIDAAKSAFRRLAWRAIEVPTDREAIRARVREGLVTLEQVRAENAQLRAAYWEMRAALLEGPPDAPAEQP
jgi:hypothetical protein